MKNPCVKDCPNRKPGCHSQCVEYFKWSHIQKAKKRKEAEYKKKEATALLYDRAAKTNTRWQKNVKN